MSDEFQRASIKQVLARLGLPVPEHQRQACPVHGGTNKNNFSISDDGLFWKCHSKGGCGGGDALELIKKVKNIDNKEAIKLYKEWFGQGSGHKTYKPKVVKTEGNTNNMSYGLSEFCKFLKEPAHEYLESRKLTFDECPLYKWPVGLTEEIAKKHGFENIYLSLKASKGNSIMPAHDAYLVMPYLNIDGTIGTVQGRYAGNPPKDVPKSKFFKGSSKQYSVCKNKTGSYRSIIICEGIFEGATINKCLDDNNYLVMSASDKSTPFTGIQDILLETHEVIFMPDNDDNGEGLKGFEKLASKLVSLGHDNVKIAKNYLPASECKDYNELLQRDGIDICKLVISRVLARKESFKLGERRATLDVKDKQAIDGERLKEIIIRALNNEPFKIIPKRLPRSITKYEKADSKEEYAKRVDEFYASIKPITYPNLKRILKRCRFNKFSQAIEFNTNSSEDKRSNKGWLVDLKNELGMMGFTIKKDTLEDTMSYLDIWQQYNSFNPYEHLYDDRFTGGSIEISPHLKELLTQFYKFQNTENALTMLNHWLTHMWFMAVRANYNHELQPTGYACHAVPIIWGSKGLNKSNLVYTLAYNPYAVYNASLKDKMDDEKVAMKQLGKMVGFYDEFEIQDYHLADFKAKVTSGFNRFRHLFSTDYFEAPRTDVLIGTANESKHHIDPNGDRRTWPIKMVALGKELTPTYKAYLMKEIGRFYYNKVKQGIDRLDGDVNEYFYQKLIKGYDQVQKHMEASGEWEENKGLAPHIDHMHGYFKAVKHYLINKQYNDEQPQKQKANGDMYAVNGSPIFEVRKKLKNRNFKGVFKAEFIEYCKVVGFRYQDYERAIATVFVDQAKQAGFKEFKNTRVGDDYANYPIKTYKIADSELVEDNEPYEELYEDVAQPVINEAPRPVAKEQLSLQSEQPSEESKLHVKPNEEKLSKKDDDDFIF